MSLFQKFLIQFHRLTTATTDEDKRHADERFIRSVESIERTIKRSLRGSEYRVLFTFDDHQAELIKNILKEAKNNGEVQNN